ncbi:hypothetical protein E5N72_13735 [Pseudoalteromonas sp. MEBiC 03607]|jgi:hypothetical protein|uniref:hypothetical protein n=1 Tax=Pseudoalteromonas TaxID=53246 RepID=UPI000EC9AE97|nr:MULTISPECIES: hypothetical protein [unclassified Pseudoalteromonas]HCV01753.1 hypothetical protein [Pseudoalteromonas sp.]MCF2899825.1 hypothetical protein [Pseudoalteromonas sp. OFAV1]MCF2921659.1 hypothetical protein [Pseudoalteromonas sp. APAL1]MCO7250821.1 hypothetical protein [Pseudoalteromonas sp. Ps84H-4]TGV21043.1 hypothetical protein E5N72_13735 [Pseudoalteromonas sp. MEBiC 03607]|tara:strand:- start:84 stop:527 length:444 start_codon:yes stop_codon:yes gene_type:complete
MSNKIKKQSLLGKTPERKKPTQAKRQRPVNQQQARAQAAQQSIPEIELKKSKARWYTLAAVVLILLITPKPILITYEKLGMVSQSVFWPGIFGYGANLFDSTLSPRADLSRNVIYLCQDKRKPDTCQKYRVTDKSGFFAAMKKLTID